MYRTLGHLVVRVTLDNSHKSRTWRDVPLSCFEVGGEVERKVSVQLTPLVHWPLLQANETLTVEVLHEDRVLLLDTLTFTAECIAVATGGSHSRSSTLKRFRVMYNTPKRSPPYLSLIEIKLDADPRMKQFVSEVEVAYARDQINQARQRMRQAEESVAMWEAREARLMAR